MIRISIIGDLFCDILASTQKLPTWGTDTLASGIQLLPGGSGLNSAIHATKYIAYKDYPIKISLCGAVGEDMFSSIMKRAIEDNAIEDHVVTKPGARSGSCIVMTSHMYSDRCFITDRGVVDDMALGWFREESLIPSDTKHVHIGGFYNLGKLKDEIHSVLKKALEGGLTTSLNPQFDATDKWDSIEPLAPFLSFLICSEMELSAITRCEDKAIAARRVLDWGCENVVVTLGPDGAEAYSTGGVIAQRALDVVVADTTGAGDAFVGAFISEYVQTKNLQDALLAGCATAAAGITVIGGSSVPPVHVLSESYDKLKHLSI